VVEKTQALDDTMVEIDKLGLGQLVNVDRHSSAIDESRAGAIERMSGQRICLSRGTVQALKVPCPSGTSAAPALSRPPTYFCLVPILDILVLLPMSPSARGDVPEALDALRIAGRRTSRARHPRGLSLEAPLPGTLFFWIARDGRRRADARRPVPLGEGGPSILNG
jgi:hypothetical protein